MDGWERHRGIWLPRTGQTTVYRTGDDGDLQAGWPGTTRMVDLGNGTVYDRATGLTWVKDHAGMGAPWNGTMVWDDAIDNCLALSYAGFSDWYLPTKRQLNSIYAFEGAYPYVVAPLVVVGATYYWSSTTRDGVSSYAWSLRTGVSFDLGGTLTKASSYYALPVRGGRVSG